jgi:Putative beta barrel porin-7 (BBP7)
MKIHLPWIRVTAIAVLVAGVGMHEAAAQYAPYRPIPQQPTAPAAAVPVVAAPPQAQAPAIQNPYTTPVYTAYRTPAAAPQSTAPYGMSPSTQAYGSPTGAQYTQPTAAYPQYPQTPSQQYPATSGPYSYVAQQPASGPMPGPSKPMSTSAAQPSASSAMSAPADKSMPVNNMSTSAAQPGGCGCNAATYGAGNYFTSPACGCAATGGYPNCGANNYFGDNCCNENQWFGGIYFLEMGRTNSSPVKLTSQMPTGVPYPGYYPTANDTVLTSRDANYDFREGMELRVGSTFTIGDSCNACQSSCGYNTGCGCNSCTPQTTYAWEVAWWGLDDSPNTDTAVYDTTNRLVGMKNFIGLQYNGGRVNNYYGYGMPVDAPDPAMPQVLAQRVRTDFKAQNLELNFIRFPVCNTGCSTGSCGGGACAGGGYDACGCNSNNTGCNGGCEESCGAFAMYGSCGVRYFHVDDDFMYADEYSPTPGARTYNGFGSGDIYELYQNIQVKNNLIGPQVGWTTDYCLGRWNLFCNSTFGIFDNHMSVWQRLYDGTGTLATFAGDGSTYNIRSHKDAVAFLGELRVGTAYDFSCHWRGVLAYRAVAITGVATASDQLQNDYSDRYSAGIISSDNSMIIHGAQIGAECRY